ncbi:MAG TPA: metallophosphoesterase [Gemmatimonadales bacterium]|nr:metallophosphoesterase [Gemmatimonadales bacterium]
MSRHYSLPLRLWEEAQAVLLGSGWSARVAYRLGGQRTLEVSEHDVALAGRERGRPPLRVAFASDFHAGPTTHDALLDHACERLAELRPDLLLLGGDFVSFDARCVDRLAERLGAIPAPFGRFAVLGNHDWWTDPARVTQRLEAAGVRMLTNRSARLDPPHDDLWVCGLDDWLLGEPDAGAALAGATGLRLVLMHEPSTLLDLGDAPFALALCGHTHGGQIALPGGLAPVVPAGRLSRRYVRGRYALAGGRTLIVSRGVGFSTVPVRLFAPSEIHLCTLAGPDPAPHPADQAAALAEGNGRLPHPPATAG